MSLLQELNSSLKKKVSNNQVAKHRPLSFYKELKENGTAVEITFSGALPDGTLYANDQGNALIMRSVSENKSSYRIYKYTGERIGTPTMVYIDEIDEKENRIYVRPVARSDSRAKDTIIEINKEIGDLLHQGQQVRVAGRIIEIYEKRALVDILNKGVIGVIEIRDWKETFTRSLETVCRKNGIYEFLITGKNKNSSGEQIRWNLTRKGIAADPWKSISDLFKENGTCVVKCIEVINEGNKQNWWGNTPDLPDIEVYGNFNSKFEVIPGMYYNCRIRTIDKEKHIFKVSPFELASGSGGINVVYEKNNDNEKKEQSQDDASK